MGAMGSGITRGSVLVALLGLVFVLGGVTFWFDALLGETASIQKALYELVIHVFFGSVILILGVHIERSELSQDERRAVMLWCFGGFLFLLMLAIWSSVDRLVVGEIPPAFVSNVVVFGSMGGAFGAVAGVNWGRAARNAKLAEENERQRETLELLTRLLGHDIRNDLQLIRGHVDLLTEHVEPAGKERLGVIESRTDTISRLLEDADTLVQALGSDHEREPIALTPVLNQEITRIDGDYPSVEVSSSIEDNLEVLADGLIAQLFSNLLENAVSHNDPEDLQVSVTARDRGGDVEVIVADNGRGIPEEFREQCFELGEQGPDSDGDGIGLYLVSRLADVYGGSVTLDESTRGGAEFRVRLPAAGERIQV